MLIGRAARSAGATIKAIHYYERIGLIPRPPRGGAYRLYDDEAVARIRFIKCCQKAGFALDEIRQALPAYEAGRLHTEDTIALIRRKRELLEQELRALQQRIEALSEIESRLADEPASSLRG